MQGTASVSLALLIATSSKTEQAGSSSTALCTYQISYQESKHYLRQEDKRGVLQD